MYSAVKTPVNRKSEEFELINLKIKKTEKIDFREKRTWRDFTEKDNFFCHPGSAGSIIAKTGVFFRC